MLLVPIHKKFDWKHPPVVTLLIIAVNIFVFLLFQLDDDAEEIEALRYYQESGLAEIEYKPALSYAEQNREYELARILREAEGSRIPFWVVALQANPDFMAALNRGEVITPSHPLYEEWRSKRDKFNEYFESITYVKYGLKPAQPTAISLLSHMFLHADFWHLFGNMVFLLAVGMLVEAALSKKVYFVSYILAGVGSALFDLVFRSEELMPGIGASGAIAGMMGAYTVLYGMKRVRFFYFIGVYFDYVSLPAITLLPLWIGNELVQMQVNVGSNVNFMAHVGGLCSGAPIAFIIRRFSSGVDLKYLEKDEDESNLGRQLERAKTYLSEFKPESALPILKRLYSKQPSNREILVLYYESSRVNTMSDDYHALAHAIFALQDTDAATDRLVLETFNDYLKLARPSTRMSSAMVCRLARRFIRQKATTEAERLIRVILAKKVSCPQNHQLITSFARLLDTQGRSDDSRRYLQLIPSREST